MSRKSEREASDHIEHEIMPMIDRGELAEAMAELWALAGEERIEKIRPLIVEAHDLMRCELLSEARHRLGLIINPKWPSVEACSRDYRAAMRATRAARKNPPKPSIFRDIAP